MVRPDRVQTHRQAGRVPERALAEQRGRNLLHPDRGPAGGAGRGPGGVLHEEFQQGLEPDSAVGHDGLQLQLQEPADDAADYEGL